mgnify:CR=1 FL=1
MALSPAQRRGLSVGVATGLYGISFGALAVAAGLTVGQACVLSLLMFAFKVKINEKMHAEIVEQLEAKLTAGEVSDEEAKTVETVEAVNEKAKTLTE